MPEYLFRDTPPIPVEIACSEGSYLIDSKGRRYLDLKMGWCVGNAGWNRKEILGALRRFRGPTYVSPDSYSYPRWDELARRLVSIFPGKRATCFRATGGTEAVELALKISTAHNRRKRFMAFYDAYHGQSLACMGLVGLHEKVFGSALDCVRLEAKDWERTTEQAVREILKEDVCAFISEPIITNLGVAVPPKSFFEEVQRACRDTDTVFIMDEVATGFGRTGKWFGCGHYGLRPDIITVAKGFSSGYEAIGAAIAVPDVAESMRFDFSNYSTFGWLPISTEAALANMAYMKKHKLVEKSAKSGKYLAKRISEFSAPEGRGLCLGFDTGNPHVARDCFRDGLVIASFGKRAMLFPALDVSRADMDKGLGIIRKHL